MALEAFLLPLEIAPFDTESALAYGKIRAELERQGTPIGSTEMLIVAQAVAQDLTLITHNLKEFARIPGLRYETWVISQMAASRQCESGLFHPITTYGYVYKYVYKNTLLREYMK